MKKTKLSVLNSFAGIVLMSLLLSLNSCTKETESKVFIRVNNQSAASLEGIVVYSLNGEHSFGGITSGQVSAYKDVESTYNTPACSFTVEGQEYRLMVRCATPAPEKIVAGHYSILIKSFTAGNADIELVRE